ncbi:MAG: polysaccharide biosynthesis protein [Pseudomonadota bacterium]|nr:polysaccharide biosynthesis protein [Pseudomonadota bacterium]
MILNLVRRVSAADRTQKQKILLVYDMVASLLALLAAFWVRLGEPYWPWSLSVLGAAFVSVAAAILSLQQLHVYRIVLRYFDLRTVTRIFFGAAIAAAAWVLTVYLARSSMVVDGVRILVPRSVAFIYCGFLFMLLFLGRYAMAWLLREAGRMVPGAADGEKKNVAIYGANAAGISLADSVRKDPQYSFRAFVDDDRALHGQIIAGARIYSPEALPNLVRREQISEIFLAIPSATRSQRLSAISRVRQLDLQVKTVPAPEEIVSGRFTVTDVRPIDVNDLLRREPVEPLTPLIREAVEGRSILITGAGGSIGSEICRQILRGKPSKLVLLDHSEYSLFQIEQQLSELAQGIEPEDRPVIIPIVGSMLNELLVRSLIRAHGVDTVYHAAAYKHVPLLEHNEVVGVENNVMGTLVLARLAVEEKLTRFTMISTDKAVRPESVMGASKRVAELVIQALAHEEGCPTRFGIVRFGNVLDSSGSVVQRFRSQIAAGGPVTVTHPDITRYFMSIPEATQLVLQASAIAAHGEVFVLDMGEPIRIADLARNMISLSGMTVRDEENPAGDIEIAYVGLRPGEKLYEELFVGEEARATAHPRIQMAKERFISFAQLGSHIEALRAAIFAGDAAAVRAKLQELTASDRAAEAETHSS